jgi:4-aminobutyrate aminotransferase-like enzyme
MTRIRSLLDARQQLLGRNLSISYDNPLNIVRGSMQYLYDDSGRRYLDAYNNVAHVGHCHSEVVAAGQEQMAVLNTNTRYLNDLILRYAENLTATLPEPLRVCFFVNSGSEANELALRLARAHTKAREMLVLDHAYHGNTTTLIDLSPYKHNGPGGDGAPSWVHTLPLPDLYRGEHREDDPHAAEKYAQHVVEVCESRRPRLCGFLAESLPSVAGQIVLPAGYLARIYEAVRGAGGVCIADEVQTGYGRIGTHFWGFEKYGVVPDIVVLGKPIGNGHPIGAVITTRAIAESFANGMEFFSTFGGNNVSCAIGLKVLEVVQKEKLQEHALHVGERLLKGLRDLQQRHSIIGDVRGSGLFLGVELVRDRDSRLPAATEANWVVNQMREQGILLGTDGPFHNVIKIRPPMPFSESDGDFLLETLGGILATDYAD